jgi:hypothetical protein
MPETPAPASGSSSDMGSDNGSNAF